MEMTDWCKRCHITISPQDREAEWVGDFRYHGDCIKRERLEWVERRHDETAHRTRNALHHPR